MIIVIGTADAAAGQEDRVRALSLEHVHRSRQEPGCIRHEVNVDCERPGRFVFVEYWRDMDALNAHFALPASRSFMDELRPLLASAPSLEIFQSDAVN
ncbi:MAG: putative quinol monooxygenase [Pseudomonadota bacterium]